MVAITLWINTHKTKIKLLISITLLLTKIQLLKISYLKKKPKSIKSVKNKPKLNMLSNKQLLTKNKLKNMVKKIIPSKHSKNKTKLSDTSISTSMTK